LWGHGLARVVALEIEHFSLFFSEFDEIRDLFDNLGKGSFALLLQLAEHGDILLHVTLDAVFVEAEELDVLALGEPGAGLGGGDIDLGIVARVLIGLWVRMAKIEPSIPAARLRRQRPSAIA
jgi:hypothetical protein